MSMQEKEFSVGWNGVLSLLAAQQHEQKNVVAIQVWLQEQFEQYAGPDAEKPVCLTAESADWVQIKAALVAEGSGDDATNPTLAGVVGKARLQDQSLDVRWHFTTNLADNNHNSLDLDALGVYRFDWDAHSILATIVCFFRGTSVETLHAEARAAQAARYAKYLSIDDIAHLPQFIGANGVERDHVAIALLNRASAKDLRDERTCQAILDTARDNDSFRVAISKNKVCRHALHDYLGVTADGGVFARMAALDAATNGSKVVAALSDADDRFARLKTVADWQASENYSALTSADADTVDECLDDKATQAAMEAALPQLAIHVPDVAVKVLQRADKKRHVFTPKDLTSALRASAKVLKAALTKSSIFSSAWVAALPPVAVYRAVAVAQQTADAELTGLLQKNVGLLQPSMSTLFDLMTDAELAARFAQDATADPAAALALVQFAAQDKKIDWFASVAPRSLWLDWYKAMLNTNEIGQAMVQDVLKADDNSLLALVKFALLPETGASAAQNAAQLEAHSQSTIFVAHSDALQFLVDTACGQDIDAVCANAQAAWEENKRAQSSTVNDLRTQLAATVASYDEKILATQQRQQALEREAAELAADRERQVAAKQKEITQLQAQAADDAEAYNALRGVVSEQTAALDAIQTQKAALEEAARAGEDGAAQKAALLAKQLTEQQTVTDDLKREMAERTSALELALNAAVAEKQVAEADAAEYQRQLDLQQTTLNEKETAIQEQADALAAEKEIAVQAARDMEVLVQQLAAAQTANIDLQETLETAKEQLTAATTQATTLQASLDAEQAAVAEAKSEQADLQAQLADLGSESSERAAQLQAELALLATSLAEKEKSAAAFESQLVAASEEKAQLTAQVSDATTQLASRSASNAALNEQLQQAMAAQETTSEETARTQQALQEALAKRAEDAARLEQLQRELDAQSTEAARQTAELAVATAQLATAREAEATQEVQLLEMQTTLTEKTTELTSVSEETDRLHAQVSDLEGRMAVLATKKASAEKRVSEMTSQRDEKADELAALVSEKEALAAELVGLRSEQEATVATLSEKDSALLAAEKAVATAAETLTVREQRIGEDTQVFKAAKAKLEGILDEQRTALTQAQEAAEAARSAQAEALAKIDEAEKQLDEKGQAVTQLTEENTELQAAVEAATAECDAAKTQSATLTNELAAATTEKQAAVEAQAALQAALNEQKQGYARLEADRDNILAQAEENAQLMDKIHEAAEKYRADMGRYKTERDTLRAQVASQQVLLQQVEQIKETVLAEVEKRESEITQKFAEEKVALEKQLAETREAFVSANARRAAADEKVQNSPLPKRTASRLMANVAVGPSAPPSPMAPLLTAPKSTAQASLHFSEDLFTVPEAKKDWRAVLTLLDVAEAEIKEMVDECREFCDGEDEIAEDMWTVAADKLRLRRETQARDKKEAEARFQREEERDQENMADLYNTFGVPATDVVPTMRPKTDKVARYLSGVLHESAPVVMPVGMNEAMAQRIIQALDGQNSPRANQAKILFKTYLSTGSGPDSDSESELKPRTLSFEEETEAEAAAGVGIAEDPDTSLPLGASAITPVKGPRPLRT